MGHGAVQHGELRIGKNQGIAVSTGQQVQDAAQEVVGKSNKEDVEAHRGNNW